jgi:sigma-B regulation protein RsbU (phosphoserine phosphatase)
VLAGSGRSKYTSFELILDKNDEILLYTDGVTEAANNQYELFGDERFVNFVNENYENDMKEFNKKIMKEIKKFEDGAEQTDDITMVFLRYVGDNQMKEIILEANIENINKAIDFINENFSDLSNKSKNRLCIIIDEIFANICNYSYTDAVEKEYVTIRILNQNEVILEFEDTGIAFDPLSETNPDIEKNIKERKVGGLGIYMVKKLAKSVVYNRINNKNVLTVKL